MSSGSPCCGKIDISMDAQNPSTPVYARILARSRRQAMDWSLVLASQEIHPIITEPSEMNEWILLVQPEQHEKALEAIRLYRLENRGWAWRKELPGSDLALHSGAAFWCVVLGFWHWVATFISQEVVVAGRMDSIAVQNGEWWRLFTAVTLHSDLAHLMANVTFGFLMLGLAMARFGFGITLLATLLAGVAGNIAGLTLYSAPYFGVGASGMMMGALGLLCIHSIALWRFSRKAARYILSGVIAGVFIFLMFGVNPSSDIIAHLGGFISGMVAGAVLAFIPESKLQRVPLNFAAVGLVGLILAVTWTLALR